MKLSKRVKVLVGLATAWMVLYPLLFIGVWFTMMSGIMFRDARSSEVSPEVMFPFMAIFPLHCLSIFIIFALIVFYMAHIVKNREGSEVLRIITGVGLYFMPYFAMPLYYIAYIWPETPPDWALQKPPSASVDPIP